MANQSQPRPWLRLGSLARPTGPSPAAPRPQMQPPSALLPRPTLTRPTFRPPNVTQPGQDVAPPLQPPRLRAPPPLLPAVTPAFIPPPLPPSPVSPPKSLPKISTTSPVIQKSPLASPVIQNSRNASPVIQNSPRNASRVIQNSRNASPVIYNSPRNASPVTQKSPPASPVTQKYPSVQRASPTSLIIPSQSPLPSSPKPRNQSPPPSIPSSPAMKHEVASKPLLGSHISTPVPSPRTAKPLPETPPESPKNKPGLNSPPLFSLPPSQLNSNGIYEKNIPAISEKKTVRKPYDDNFVKPKAQEIKRVSDSEDIGMRVITISGENRGAVMELGYPPRTHGNSHKLKSGSELSEGNQSGNEVRNHNGRAKASAPMHAFMNSNVQGINSSIVFNSKLSHHDPGVHLSMSRNPVKGRLKEHSNGHNGFQKEAGYRLSD